MTNTAENQTVPSDQTIGSKQALTGRQQQVSSAQLLAEQQLPQSHATAAAERTALAAIENMASTGQLQPSPLCLWYQCCWGTTGAVVLVTPLSELRLPPVPLIAQLLLLPAQLLLLPMAELVSMMLPLLAAVA